MQSQGEVMKTWRRRWFILKQGFLFRFSNPDVNSSTKPRGVVDLSKVTDVSEARDQTGKLNSLKLSTETGFVAYVCDSETELVEWISALEGAVSLIVRKVRPWRLGDCMSCHALSCECNRKCERIECFSEMSLSSIYGQSGQFCVLQAVLPKRCSKQYTALLLGTFVKVICDRVTSQFCLFLFMQAHITPALPAFC